MIYIYYLNGPILNKNYVDIFFVKDPIDFKITFNSFFLSRNNIKIMMLLTMY